MIGGGSASGRGWVLRGPDSKPAPRFPGTSAGRLLSVPQGHEPAAQRGNNHRSVSIHAAAQAVNFGKTLKRSRTGARLAPSGQIRMRS